MSKTSHRVMTGSNGYYGPTHEGLGLGELMQAKQQLNTLNAQDRAQVKQQADMNLQIDLARTGINLLKTVKDPQARALVEFMETNGLDNNSLVIANQTIREHLSYNQTAMRALDYFNTTDHVNTHGISDNTSGHHESYQKVQGHVDPFTGHTSFSYSTNKDGTESDSNVFAMKQNDKFNDLATHFDIVEE